MKIGVISDVHIEQHADAGVSFAGFLEAPADVLVIAGDFAPSYVDAFPALSVLCSKYEHVVYVAGNHEYWGSTIAQQDEKMLEYSSRISNLHTLNNSAVTLNAQRFVGTTLWFPRTPDAHREARDWIDFSKVKVVMIDDLFFANTKASEFLKNSVKPGDVVVTHHLPSFRSVDPRFGGYVSNCYYVSDETQTIATNEPALWVHGHTHRSADYKLLSTRVVCNPLGNVLHDQNRDFEWPKVVEI